MREEMTYIICLDINFLSEFIIIGYNGYLKLLIFISTNKTNK